MGAENVYAGLFDKPSDDFRAVQQGRVNYPDSVDIDLSNTFSIAAGNAVEVVVPGNFFYSDMDPVNQGGFNVHFQDTTFTVKKGMYCPPGFISKVPFTKFLIENFIAQPGKRARIFYGTDVAINPGGAAQVSVTGTVSTIDGGKANTKAGIAFCGAVGVSPGANTWGHVQLANLAGNTVNAVVTKMRINESVANGWVDIFPSGTALATPVGKCRSKLSPALQTSQSSLRTESGAVSYMPAIPYDSVFLNVGNPLTYEFKEPIVLTPGNTLTLRTATGTAVNASFEFTEEAP